MKTALITTTINIPHVLKFYRACGPDVAFFVALDEKSKDFSFSTMGLHCGSLPSSGDSGAWAYSPDEQKALGYACSDLIGWNTIGRRSIALLEALKWGADVIVTIDDDNIPMSTDYFDRFEMVLNTPVLQPHQYDANGGWSGIKVRGYGDWFDVGQLLDPVAPHRGFPTKIISMYQCAPVVGAKIGVAAGICLGDPDIAAITRLAHQSKPIDVHRVSELLRSGIVVDPGTKTVFNSQNTAFLRELAPCFLMVPQWKRYDDIWSSLIAQKVMRDRGFHVHFGQPFVLQQRNPHNLLKDLDAEIFGMHHMTEFAELLDAVQLPGKSVIEDVRTLWGVIRQPPWMPEGVSALASAWLEDCEAVL